MLGMKTSNILKSSKLIFFSFCVCGLKHYFLARYAIIIILIQHFTNRSNLVEFISFGVKKGEVKICERNIAQQ